MVELLRFLDNNFHKEIFKSITLPPLTQNLFFSLKHSVRPLPVLNLEWMADTRVSNPERENHQNKIRLAFLLIQAFHLTRARA